jgi:hypothetical protein
MEKVIRALGAALALVLWCSIAFADTATVKRPSNLRADHDVNAALVKHLDVATQLTVLDEAPQNGYLHVKTAGGDEGWVFSRNVTVAQKQPAHHAKKLPARAATAKSRSSGPCFPTFDQCPDDGCAKANSADAALNNRKRHLLADDGSAVTLNFADLRTLQDTSDTEHVPQEANIKDRTILADFDIGGGRHVGEGKLIQVAGFIAPDRTLGKGSAESVNCRLTSEHDTDVHIPIVEDAESSEWESFVAEPIPQHRSPTWTVTRWRKIQDDGSKVLVRGQLLYDNKHRVNDDPNDPQGTQPKRFTIWEIHPITAIFVCGLPTNDCDATKEADWLPVK